jgi:hypothetical protein
MSFHVPEVHSRTLLVFMTLFPSVKWLKSSTKESSSHNGRGAALNCWIFIAHSAEKYVCCGQLSLFLFYPHSFALLTHGRGAALFLRKEQFFTALNPATREIILFCYRRAGAAWRRICPLLSPASAPNWRSKCKKCAEFGPVANDYCALCQAPSLST